MCGPYPDPGQEDAMRELLERFVPDLLTERRNEAFVRHLFAAEKGRWYSARAFCGGLTQADRFWAALAPLTGADLKVIWLDHPEAEDGVGFVVFHLDDIFWTTSAVYTYSMLPLAKDIQQGPDETPQHPSNQA